MSATYQQDRLPSAVPTPRVNVTQSAPGETPKPRVGRSKYGSLSTQKFQIAHQSVNLDIDMCKKRIHGYTELSVVPTSSSLRVIRLDARTMSIKKVSINGSELSDYVHNDHLYINDPEIFEKCATTRVPNVWDEYSSEFTIHQHHLLRQKLSHIFGHLEDDENNFGESGETLNTEELLIILPENTKFELTDMNNISQTPNSALPSTFTPGHLRLKSGISEVYSPIQIGIEYEIINSKDGLNFVCNSSMDKRMWHVYTSNSEHNISASSWVPCIDSFHERSSWSIELSIPRSVNDIADAASFEGSHEKTSGYTSIEKVSSGEGTGMKAGDDAEDSDVEIGIDEDDDDRENYDLFVCTGDVINTKEAPHPTNLSKKLVSWSVFNPVCAHHIGWAVGAYQSIELSDFSDSSVKAHESEEELETMEKDETNSLVSLFYLPGQEEMVKNTCIFAQKALDFFSKEYGSYPFSSYGIAFVQDSRYPRNNFAGLSLLDADLLYPATIIEPMFTTTEEILECLAAQWSGISIVPLGFNDLWCTIGIAKFMSFQFIKSLVGSNEFRYQIRQKMAAIVEQDVGQRPLGLQAFEAPISESSFDFIRLKAPIILFILDRRMTKTDKSFGFMRVLPKLFLQAISGDLPNGALSTLHFQYVCEKVNRNRLESFFKQWVYGVGTPIFNITQKFNKKRSLIEVIIRQSQLQQARTPHPKADTFMRDAVSFLNSEQTFPVQQTFLGPMTIRVHEADGTPYEHIVDIKDKVVKFDVQYNTKFKRLKKSKEEIGEGGSVFSKLGDVLEEETDLKNWKFEEWPKRDEEFLDPFEWLRVDTDFEWIATFNLKQPDYMFGSQLQQDRDIEAQISACEFFGSQEKPNAVYCTMLTRTLIDSRYFYGVRIAAARALASASKSGNQYLGLSYLLSAFKQMYCFDNSLIPKSNNFQDFGEYFVQKAIPEILARVKDEHGLSPSKVKNLLYNLLKYNDNSSNDFEDCFYVSALVRALVKSVIPINEDGSVMENLSKDLTAFEEENKDRRFVKTVVDEIERLEKLDLWVPSYQAHVLNTCLEQKIRLARSNLCKVTFEELLHLTHPKNHPQQRILAFEGMFLLGGLKNAEILKYFLRVCLLERTSAHFQSKLLCALVNSISEAAIQGIPSAIDDPEFRASEEQEGLNGDLLKKSSMVVVEESQTSEMNMRRDAFARATIKGAIEVLRRELAVGLGLQSTLWELLHTSLLSLSDKKVIFILCDILYDAVASFPVTISVPCVPFEELKKKIIAKITGDGMVTIKREARFKIQLSSRLISTESRTKPSGPIEKAEPKTRIPEPISVDSRDATPAAPKLKLKISSNTEIKPKEEKKVELPSLASGKLVSRDSSNKMQLKFRLNKQKLGALKPSTTSCGIGDGLVVKMNFKKAENKLRLVDLSKHKRPPRYVKIFLKGKKVETSTEPFPERMVQPDRIDADKDDSSNDDENKGSGVSHDLERGPNKMDDITPKLVPLLDSKNSKSDEHESNDRATERSDRALSHLEKPKPFKRASSEELASDRSRAASPFSRESSPGKVAKRKKTKIYIHGQPSNSPSPTGLSNEIIAGSVPGEEQSSKDLAAEGEENATTGASIEENEADAPVEEPKRKLKLKLSLK
ncbi:hypothetical protein OXX80_007799 [Metschnikowia pulcherrima]